MQTWTLTVAAELRRLGHSVVIASPRCRIGSGYDIGIFANTLYTGPLLGHCWRSISISHGIVADEAPTTAGLLAFTSEEVLEHWWKTAITGPHPDRLIVRQPIDLDFWRPSGLKRSRKTMVRYANRGGLPRLPEVANRLGLQYVHVRNATPEQARGMLQDAAVVFASGRCAVEAAACGAPVVICDDRPYQGPLCAAFTIKQMAKNYSGRGGELPDTERLVGLANTAIDAVNHLPVVHELHDVRRVVAKLMGIFGC